GFYCFSLFQAAVPGFVEDIEQSIVVEVEDEGYPGLDDLSQDDGLVLVLPVAANRISSILGELIIDRYVAGEVGGGLTGRSRPGDIEVASHADPHAFIEQCF